MRLLVGGDDGVPDDGAGGGGGWMRGGVAGEDVDEELFGVPGEEGGEVCGGLVGGFVWMGKGGGGLVPASRSNLMWAYSSFLLE